ncbi:hypothetical protein CRE_13986 [Caenorhabditis remanei]|uniref:Uncharacterized protein n=1 Tax=Caenorhabditis remanei TaxID=31234 RepID=E3M8N6_CAERE|nr:hypothetical protein CRE_13986 [Caenorhabditis remanei]
MSPKLNRKTNPKLSRKMNPIMIRKMNPILIRKINLIRNRNLNLKMTRNQITNREILVLLVHALVSLGQAGIDTENMIRNNTYLIRLKLDQQLKIKQLNHPWLLHNIPSRPIRNLRSPQEHRRPLNLRRLRRLRRPQNLRSPRSSRSPQKQKKTNKKG